MAIGVVMSRSVTLVKGKNNMIGISIGGGAPMCPVLYVVQVHCLYMYVLIHTMFVYILLQFLCNCMGTSLLLIVIMENMGHM